VFNALHLVDLVMIGLVLRLPKFMVYYGFSPGFIVSYLSTGQVIGWKERLRYDLCCVEWDVKPQLNQSINQSFTYRCKSLSYILSRKFVAVFAVVVSVVEKNSSHLLAVWSSLDALSKDSETSHTKLPI